MANEEWRKVRDHALLDVFQGVLEVQEETGTQLWFQWSPHVSGVEVFAPAGADTWEESTREHEYVSKMTYFEEDEDPHDTAARIMEKVWSWRDKKLAVKKIVLLRSEIKDKQEQIKKLEEKYGKEN